MSKMYRVSYLKASPWVGAHRSSGRRPSGSRVRGGGSLSAFRPGPRSYSRRLTPGLDGRGGGQLPGFSNFASSWTNVPLQANDETRV